MSQSKEKVRQRCRDLMQHIAMLERNDKYGHEVWHRAKDALERALNAYRQFGATTVDIVNLGGFNE